MHVSLCAARCRNERAASKSKLLPKETQSQRGYSQTNSDHLPTYPRLSPPRRNGKRESGALLTVLMACPIRPLVRVTLSLAIMATMYQFQHTGLFTSTKSRGGEGGWRGLLLTFLPSVLLLAFFLRARHLWVGTYRRRQNLFARTYVCPCIAWCVLLVWSFHQRRRTLRTHIHLPVCCLVCC